MSGPEPNLRLPAEAGGTGQEYVRRLFANILDRYKDVHNRMQVLLTINGIFLSFLVGNIITRRVDLDAIIQSFGPETWALLVLMTTAMGLSILWVILCLSPGIASDGTVKAEVAALRGQDSGAIPATVMWYFHHIAVLDREEFVSNATQRGTVLETEALATQAHILSGRLVQKFRYARRAFVATGVSFFCFLLTGASYLLRVALV